MLGNNYVGNEKGRKNFRHSFRYAYYVTTYPIFRRERRAICTHLSEQVYFSVQNIKLLLSPVFYIF